MHLVVPAAQAFNGRRCQFNAQHVNADDFVPLVAASLPILAIVAETASNDGASRHAERVVVKEPLDRHRCAIEEQSVRIAIIGVLLQIASLDSKGRIENGVEDQECNASEEPFE